MDWSIKEPPPLFLALMDSYGGVFFRQIFWVVKSPKTALKRLKKDPKKAIKKWSFSE